MSRGSSLAKATVGVMIATLASQSLGFGREIIIAAQLGVTSFGDAFKIASFIPMMLFSIVNYALTNTFIPLLAEQEKKTGKTGVSRYVANVSNVITALLVLFTLGGMLLNPWIVKAIAPGFTPDTYRLTVSLTYWVMPIIILLGLSGLATGYLNFYQVFVLPRLGGIIFNLLIIISLVVLVPKWGVFGAIAAMIAGYSAQVIFLLIAAWYHGYRFQAVFQWRDPYLFRMLKLASPMLIGTAAGVIAKSVHRIFASSLAEGCISALDYAALITDFSLGIFVSTICNVYFPTLSRAGSTENWPVYRQHFLRATSIIIYIMLPVSAGLMVLGEPIVSLVFERGAFGSRATEMTVIALFFYSAGLVGSSLQNFFSQAFYAVQDTVTPIINGFIMVVLNIFLTAVLIRSMGLGGITLATSLAGSVMVFYLARRLKRKINGLSFQPLKTTFIKSFISVLIMTAVVKSLDWFLISSTGMKSILPLRLFLDISAGILTYFFALIIFRSAELYEFLAWAQNQINSHEILWKHKIFGRFAFRFVFIVQFLPSLNKTVSKIIGGKKIVSYKERIKKSWKAEDETLHCAESNFGFPQDDLEPEKGESCKNEVGAFIPLKTGGFTIGFSGEYSPEEIATRLVSISDLIKCTNSKYQIKLVVKEIKSEE
ncbi:MAG: murein biosynthesis integral membrane protein MurJ [Desulfitobacteriaceae bacterium]|nr:murein biosynthesis integral membrane protein MurJ [Desulfitobacteriaceae bacterium]